MIHLAMQNPSSYVGEPDMAPAGDSAGIGPILLGAVLLYALAFWLVLKGPLQHWAEEHQGGAWAVLALGPTAIMFLFIAASR